MSVAREQSEAEPRTAYPAGTVLLLITQFTTVSTTLDNPSVHLCYQLQSGAALTTPTDVCTALATAWTTKPTGAFTNPTGYLGPSVSRNANRASVTSYDVSNALGIGQVHGSPTGQALFTPGSPGTGNQWLPEGVGAAVSYRSDYGTDVEFGPPTGNESGRFRPRATHRNRFYWGPLTYASLQQEGVTNRCTLTTVMINDMLTWLKANAVLTAAGGNHWTLVQWSKTRARILPPSVMWMDDRPDYQRRRSDQSNIRTTQSF